MFFFLQRETERERERERFSQVTRRENRRESMIYIKQVGFFLYRNSCGQDIKILIFVVLKLNIYSGVCGLEESHTERN